MIKLSNNIEILCKTFYDDLYVAELAITQGNTKIIVAHVTENGDLVINLNMTEKHILQEIITSFDKIEKIYEEIKLS